MNNKMVQAISELGKDRGQFASNYEGFFVINGEIKMFTEWISFMSQDFYFVQEGFQTEIYREDRETGTLEYVGNYTDEIYDYDNEYDKNYLYKLKTKMAWSNYKTVTLYDDKLYISETKDFKTANDIQL